MKKGSPDQKSNRSSESSLADSRVSSKERSRSSTRRHASRAKGAARHTHLPVTLEEPDVASGQATPAGQPLQPTAEEHDLSDQVDAAGTPVDSTEAVKDADEPYPDPREPLPGRAAIDRRVSMGEVIRTKHPVRRLSVDNSTPIKKAGRL
ncbi:uncharacterized protein LOC144100141 [Amblyomma americanum]